MSSRGETSGNKRSFSSKGKNVSEVCDPEVGQLSQGVVELNLNSSGRGSDWEVISRKPKNRSGSSAGKSWSPQNSNPRAWNHSRRNNNRSGRGVANPRTQATSYQASSSRGNIRHQKDHMAPQAAFRRPLQNGWNWQSIAGKFKDVEDNNVQAKEKPDEVSKEDVDDDESDVLDDSDEDLLSDVYDTDASPENLDTFKQRKWYRKFFDSLNKLTVEQINHPGMRWHCPACQGGPGAIEWYGLQPLLTHARTKGARRVKRHRQLAKLMEAELGIRGTTVVQAGETFGQWKGLKEEVKDYKIVWPPMVIIMNTRLDKDENDMWLGMGNQELIEYFSGYAASKARHSYGPQGHRGMSVLIFEGNVAGYIEAERQHRHFAEQGTDRDAWDRRRVLFHAGMRQLYGFLATEEDLNIFNQHSQGRSRLKFEMKSYQEMVVKELRQISEDNQQLNFFKNKLSSKHKHAKALEESLGILSEKLRKSTEENRIVRQRTKMQHEQSKQEMDSQDKFFEEQMKMIYEARDAKEEKFEMIQQQERDKIQQQGNKSSSIDEYRRRAEEVSQFLLFQEKEMAEFVGEREKLIEEQEKKMMEMKRRHNEEELEMEREFDDVLTRLMDKYSPHGPDTDSP